MGQATSLGSQEESHTKKGRFVSAQTTKPGIEVGPRPLNRRPTGPHGRMHGRDFTNFYLNFGGVGVCVGVRHRFTERRVSVRNAFADGACTFENRKAPNSVKKCGSRTSAPWTLVPPAPAVAPIQTIQITTTGIMGDNGETTTGDGPGGAPMNDERELETAEEAQEAQKKERRINEFVAKLSRAKDKKYQLVEILDVVKKAGSTSVRWAYKGFTAWGGPARIRAHIPGLRGKGVAAATDPDEDYTKVCLDIETDLANKAEREVRRSVAVAAAKAAKAAEAARKQKDPHKPFGDYATRQIDKQRGKAFYNNGISFKTADDTEFRKAVQITHEPGPATEVDEGRQQADVHQPLPKRAWRLTARPDGRVDPEEGRRDDRARPPDVWRGVHR